MSTFAGSRVDGRIRDGHALLRPAGIDAIDLRALERDLRAEVRGEVHLDAGNLAAYSHDSSNYRQRPLAVVLPLDADDVAAAMRACHRHGAPVLPRGCGTSLSGETINVAVVIDLSKHMRRILEVDPERRIARVQPGVIRDQLSDRTEAEHGLTFAPDTSTHAYATFGGMIGNNSCGVHSVMAGRTSDNVVELEVVTYDGVRMRVGPTSDEELERIIAEGGRRGEIYAAMRDLRDRCGDLVRERFPDIPRRVSGYNLDELLPERGFDVARALVGSEGTLAMVTEATVRLVDSPPARSLLVLGYPTIYEAADHVPDILACSPIGLEAFDRTLVEDQRAKHENESTLALLPDGDGFLMVETGGDTREESHARAREIMRRLGKAPDAPAMKLFEDEAQERNVWAVREAGLASTAYVPLEGGHWPGWEDAAVPPARLGSYLRDFRDVLERYGYRTALYGHFGDGCVHCRIDFDLRTDAGLDAWRRFLDDMADVVVKHGGSLSGEHGDGQQRAELLPRMFGDELVRAFGELKAIWDPGNRMNPHKVVDPYPIVSNLKLGQGYSPPEPETHFRYPEDGGSFAHAALRCVGAGRCRDASSGTMCPSYMVTLDEKHSTRGRARVLYEMLEGDVIADGFRSEEVADALDLCLSCKGCKTDCPVSVDMATYKAEFLSKHHKGRLRPRAAYSMGLIMLHARVAQHVPHLANALTGAPVAGALLRRLGGITTERAMPAFAPEPFTTWFARRAPVNPHADPVVLFPDTFNNFLHPETLKAALRVLESAGYRVLVPDVPVCCGRPLYDYGMLDTAKRFLEHLVTTFSDDVRAGTHVVGVEPSCVAVFRDELTNILDTEDAKRLAGQTVTLAELLVEKTEGYVPPRLHRQAVVHVHCHQEATAGQSADEELLRRMGLDFEVKDTGCCGMAGSFGFEADHYDISMAIGERDGGLLPVARDAPAGAILVADGFSCKTQVEQATDRRPLHLAQVLCMALDHGIDGPSGIHPERHYPDVVPDPSLTRVERALAVAAVGGTAALVAAAAARRLARR